MGTGAQCGKEKKKIVISLRKGGRKYVVYASVLLRSGVSRYIAAISFLRISTPHEVSLDQLSETLSVKPIYQEHLRICRCSASRVSLFHFYIFFFFSFCLVYFTTRAAPRRTGLRWRPLLENISFYRFAIATLSILSKSLSIITMLYFMYFLFLSNLYTFTRLVVYFSLF